MQLTRKVNSTFQRLQLTICSRYVSNIRSEVAAFGWQQVSSNTLKSRDLNCFTKFRGVPNHIRFSCCTIGHRLSGCCHGDLRSLPNFHDFNEIKQQIYIPSTNELNYHSELHFYQPSSVIPSTTTISKLPSTTMCADGMYLLFYHWI